MAVVMTARLELVTVSVKLISLEHPARSAFLKNMAETAQMVSPSSLEAKRQISFESWLVLTQDKKLGFLQYKSAFDCLCFV